MSNDIDTTKADSTTKAVSDSFPAGNGYSNDELVQIVRRQGRVIDLLKVQVADVILGNIEQAVMIQELTEQP
jgi:hypothetical protein